MTNTIIGGAGRVDRSYSTDSTDVTDRLSSFLDSQLSRGPGAVTAYLVPRTKSATWTGGRR